MPLSEYTTNIIENLACRAAQANGGTITPHMVLPYLPISLGIVEHCLNAMVDGAAITSGVVDGLTVYTFKAYQDNTPPAKPQLLQFNTCVACDSDFNTPTAQAICGSCEAQVQTELNSLAESMAWPAQAVYEHEILYNAAQRNTPLHPAELAAQSRFTLRSMRRKLQHLAKNRFASAEQNPAKGIATYTFPPLLYPRDHYQTNMATILTYPASIMEAVQTKVLHILMTLSMMLIIILGMAFWGFPFPFLMLLFAITAPITALLIWHHKRAPNND